jgi:glycosyltransferase involved in cell wall biosynthesis
MSEKITVVIPLYNKAPYIQRALDSVLTQTRLPDEIIVVDDGSTDGGAEIVENIGHPLIRLVRQENQGRWFATNRGITKATGELIATLDADDAWKPRFLEVVLSLREKYPFAGIYGTAYERVYKNRTEIYKGKVFNSGQRDGIIETYLKPYVNYPLTSSSVMIPENVLIDVGCYPLNNALGGNLDTYLKIYLNYPVAYSMEVLATYYLNAYNRVCNSYKLLEEPVISKTVRLSLNNKKVPDNMVTDLKEYAVPFQLYAARDCLLSGNKILALTLLKYSHGTKYYSNWWWKIRFLAMLPCGFSLWLWDLRQFWWKLKGKIQ